MIINDIWKAKTLYDISQKKSDSLKEISKKVIQNKYFHK